MVLSVLLVYALLVILFQSWVDPFIIMMAVPGALMGILWMLAVTGTTINVESLMGAIMSIGISVSNSILVVSFANDLRAREEVGPLRAVIDAGRIRLRPVLMTALATGLALKARYEELASRVKPKLDWISNISLILLVLLITVANIDKVLQVFGTRGILAGLLYIALGFGISWLLGGPGTDTRRVMALGTSQRNIAAALVVASQSFSDPKVVVIVIVVAIVGLIILMPLSRALANR